MKNFESKQLEEFEDYLDQVPRNRDQYNRSGSQSNRLDDTSNTF